MTALSGYARGISIIVTVSEDTGITGVKDDSQPATGKYYNLNGQEVERPTKGVFIHNGQKIVFPF